MNKIQLTFECTPFEAQEVCKLLDGMRKINESLYATKPVKVSETLVVGKTMMPAFETPAAKPTVKPKTKKSRNKGVLSMWTKKEMNIINAAVSFNDVKMACNNEVLLKRHNRNGIYQKFFSLRRKTNNVEKDLTEEQIAKEYLPSLDDLVSTAQEGNQPKKWFQF